MVMHHQILLSLVIAAIAVANQNGREGHFHELTTMWQREVCGGAVSEGAASEVL